MSNELWPTIRALSAWLDAENGRGDHEMAMRLLKIAEEAGEAAAAYIGWRGQNPRKGVTHTRADVEAELCDVIVTAAVSLAMVSDDPEGVFAAKLAKIAARAGVQPEPNTETQPVVEVRCPAPLVVERAAEQAVQRLVVQAANWPRRGAR